MDAGGGRLRADAVGEVEVEEGVLVLRRIHVHYTITGDRLDRDAIERVHGWHHRKCPVARSIGAAVGITTDYDIV
jgi:uncharacterized OsmC-like protein